jgi:hypothetical protein
MTSDAGWARDVEGSCWRGVMVMFGWLLRGRTMVRIVGVRRTAVGVSKSSLRLIGCLRPSFGEMYDDAPGGGRGSQRSKPWTCPLAFCLRQSRCYAWDGAVRSAHGCCWTEYVRRMQTKPPLFFGKSLRGQGEGDERVHGRMTKRRRNDATHEILYSYR